MGGIYKYAVEMVSGGMTYTQRLMTIGLGIQVILRLLPQQFEVAVLVLLNGGIYEACC
jgi:hypothetical protein